MKEDAKNMITELFALTKRMESLPGAAGRHFTPDGHLVGSIGEVYAADVYGLTLEPASNKGYDAITATGRRVEIKTTTTERGVAFRHYPDSEEPDVLIVLKIEQDGSISEVYHGPYAPVGKEIKARFRNSDRQVKIGLSALRSLTMASDHTGNWK